MRYRVLSRTGRQTFATLLAGDLALMGWALGDEEGLSHAFSAADPAGIAFAVCWALRLLWFARAYVFRATTSTIGPYFGLSCATAVMFAVQSAWSPALPGALAAYGVFPLSVLLYLLYPAGWAEPSSSAAAAHRSSLTEADYASARIFADGVGAVSEPGYTNPKLHASGAYAHERFWVQEYGNPAHPVVIMLPGMPLTPVSLASVVTGFLLTSYFVVLIEYPGTGNGRGERFSLEELRRRVRLYIEELQPNPNRPVHLYGVSGGGNAALYLAAQLPDRIASVTAVVAVAPGHRTFSFRAGRSVFWHPLTLKTKADARLTPLSVVRKLVHSEFTAIAEQLSSTDAAWHDNLEVDGQLGDPLPDDASADAYFHHAATLRRDWFSDTGPGGRAEYTAVMAAIRDRLKLWVATPGNFEAMYAPEVYPEYVEEYVRADMDGQLKGLRCPVLFVGGVGDAASKAYDSWTEHLPDGLEHEVVMARIVAPGLGGLAAHAHAGTYWRRHVLTVDRFFRQHLPGARG